MQAGRAAALVSLLLLSGCSGLEPREPLPPPPPGHTLDPLRLHDVAILYSASDTEHPAFLRHHPRLDPAHVRDTLFATLDARRYVGMRRRDEAPGDPKYVPPRILEVSIDEATATYLGQRTGRFVGKVAIVVLVNLFIFPACPDFPNIFIASDRFELVAHARWRLLDAKGQEIRRGTAMGREEGTFGDLSRGWYYYSIVRVPGCLSVESWEEISSVLAPGAEEALAGDLAVQVEKALASRQ